MASAADLKYLHRAIQLAERGRYTTPPNPCVGCVFVRDGEVLGEGWHQWAGEGHAEVNAWHNAGEAVRGATAYISLEPCAYEGRTPACANLLVKEGVARVVVAAIDPHPKVSGKGMSLVRDAGIAAECVELPEAAALNPGFNKRMQTQLPFVRIKVAASLDGRTAMASGESQWITGEAARADVQALRARSCVILTGSGTVLADDPALTVRDDRFAVDGRLRQPHIVVADSKLRTPADAKIFASTGGVTLAHCSGTHSEAPGKRWLSEGARIDLAQLFLHLGQQETNEILVEAGPTLVGAVLATSLWDELILYQAPKFLGATARPLAAIELDRLSDAIGAKIVATEQVGDDLKVVLRNPKTV